MKLYFRYFKLRLGCAMQYKASFMLLATGQALTSFAAWLTVVFLFARFHSVAGYTMREVMVCFGVAMMSFSLAECFFRGFDTFPRMISNYEFDRMLTRPRSLILQVLGSRIEFARVGRFVQALAVMLWALISGGIEWSVGRVLALLFMIAGGAALFSALFIIYAGFSFFTIEGLEFMNIFTDGGRELSQYPLDVYGSDGLLRFFTFIVPLACVQYYPFQYLTGRGGAQLALLPTFGFIFLIPALLFFAFGVRKYKSTGS